MREMGGGAHRALADRHQSSDLPNSEVFLQNLLYLTMNKKLLERKKSHYVSICKYINIYFVCFQGFNSIVLDFTAVPT